MRRGALVLEHATRTFSVRADRGRTLKELVLRRRAAGPPPVTALRDVSLHVEAGETVGIVGRNGAGKTSTLRVLAGIVPLDSGRVACGGQVVALLELGAGFGRDFSGRENILLNGALYGMSRAEIEARVAAQVEAGATLVLVSHDAALVERTCERVVVLDGGAVVFDGPAADGLGFYHELMGTIPGASASAVRTAVTGDPRTREVTPS